MLPIVPSYTTDDKIYKIYNLTEIDKSVFYEAEYFKSKFLLY